MFTAGLGEIPCGCAIDQDGVDDCRDATIDGNGAGRADAGLKARLPPVTW
ncbi:hypothetical protein [Mesorhizobium amorphae]|nr:hypothetical protein [Mesorhizobium amorphae]